METDWRHQLYALRASGLFHADWYRATYKDVDLTGLDPIEHFVRIGKQLGRSPGPKSVAVAFLADRSDVAASGSAASSRGTDIAFSVVMPTLDRKDLICAAIDSLLNQSHQKFELVIVDDGSTDGTQAFVETHFADGLTAGRIVYVRLDEPVGVCAARNIGLSVARNNWIAYLDSDNTVRPMFLRAVTEAITANPGALTFYANFQRVEDGYVAAREFRLSELLFSNFIDLGVFFHHRSCVRELGGFDNNLKRLVDWELIIRYATAHPPVHIDHVLMDYSNRDSIERISRGQSEAKARVQVHRKHRVRPTVSIVILSYNQERFIKQALDSAIAQKGDFTFEIVVSDDGSSDRTAEIIDTYSKMHPRLIRSIGSRFNHGISENFRRCFHEAAGEHVATLEGDDYWDSPFNLAEKIAFIESNPECSMVFSKIRMLRQNGETEYLERHEMLKKSMLTGQDFIDDPDMNLIVNFSSCLFKSDLVKSLPDEIYKYRLSEIALAFHLERHGPIGYLDKALTTYRHHGGGAWSGLSTLERVRSAMRIRRVVKAVAHPKYGEAIQHIIDTKYAPHLAALENET